MRFGELTFEEIGQRAAQGWLTIVPTGCTEQQGPHLPVDFDTWFVETVCLAGANQAKEKHQVEALVLPALPFSPTPEHHGYGSGYVHLPQDIHEAVAWSILSSLEEQGFRRIVIWRGCGQHDLSDVVDRFNTARRAEARAFQPDLPYHRIWCCVGHPTVPGGHADSFATSIALHLRPESVRLDRIADPGHDPVDWDDPDLDFSRYSRTGVIGDPTHASAELGAVVWSAVVDEAASILRRIAEAPLT